MVAPDAVDQSITRDCFVRLKQEDREDCPLLRTTQRDRGHDVVGLVVVDHGHRGRVAGSVARDAAEGRG